MKTTRNIFVEQVPGLPMEEQPTELVERKGVGHPDSITDAIMDSVSVELCRAYLDHFGRIMHHNIDKGLLVAGQTSPQFGGGKVDEPMKLVFGDRATYAYQGVDIPVGEIAEAAARQWLRGNLRFVDAENHIVFQNEIKPGSPELTDIFAREVIGANDTSAGVGYAPLSETERLVLATERYLNSTAFKAAFPEAGEDIKVMGYRFGRHLTLTVALAFVDRFIPDVETYFERKAAIHDELQTFVAREAQSLEAVTVDINTLDDRGRRRQEPGQPRGQDLQPAQPRDRRPCLPPGAGHPRGDGLAVQPDRQADRSADDGRGTTDPGARGGAGGRP